MSAPNVPLQNVESMVPHRSFGSACLEANQREKIVVHVEVPLNSGALARIVEDDVVRIVFPTLSGSP